MADIDQLGDHPSQILPRRNPSLVQRIAARIARIDPGLGPQPLERETTQTGVTNPDIDVVDQFFSFTYDSDRLAVYRDAEEMDSSSEDVSTALDVIANNVTTSEDGTQLCYEIHADDDALKADLDEITATAGLAKAIKKMARALVKYGDLFAEPVVNGEGKITKVSVLAPDTMWRNEDKYGNLNRAHPRLNGERVVNNPGECAFEQHESDTKKLIAAFEPWQIVHVRLNHDDTHKYGRSHLRVARLTWRKLKAVVESLVIGRLTRDFLKLVFYIDTTGLAPKQKEVVIKRFRDSIENRSMVDEKRENPFSVFTNFFLSSGYIQKGNQVVPMQTKVEAIDPHSAGQHNITDIEFLQRKLLMCLRVPAAHMNWGQDEKPGILTAQDVQYVRWLRSVQQDLSFGLEQIYNLGLLAKGRNPADCEYEIHWPALRATNENEAAQTRLATAQSYQIYMQEGVLSPGWIQKSEFGMDEEEQTEIKDELEQLAEEEADRLASLANATTQANVTPGPNQYPGGGKARPGVAPNDQDGKRKGDEGKNSQGRRIAPTKSKTKKTPPGGGSRLKNRARIVKAAGEVDEATVLLLEFLRDKGVTLEAGSHHVITEHKGIGIALEDRNAAPRFDPDGDGDDDSTPDGDTDHDYWTADGHSKMVDCDCEPHLFAHPDPLPNPRYDNPGAHQKCTECGCPWICSCHSQDSDEDDDSE